MAPPSPGAHRIQQTETGMRFGEPLIEYQVADSTNMVAASLMANEQAGHGAVVLAHAQYEGEGQRGRIWQSAAGLDLTFSVVCRPQGLRADRQFGLSKVAALAVFDAIRPNVQADVRIKWPNDVLIEGRKVAGILIRSELSGESVSSSIIGIGINVNSHVFPESLVATSLLIEGGTELDRMDLLRTVLDRFGHWWRKWEAAPDDGLVSYTDRLWTRGRWADMLLDGQPISARALDVDEHGRLVIELPDGRVSAFGLDRLRFAPRTPGLHG